MGCRDHTRSVGFLPRDLSHMLTRSVLGVVVVACSTTVARVTVPTDPSKDTPPTITLTAVPLAPPGQGAVGNVEPAKASVTTTTDVKVTRGAPVQLLANAVSRGGVATLKIEVSQRGAVVYTGTATNAKDSAGTALNALLVKSPDGDPSKALEVTLTDPVALTATATNFNNQSTTITATYVPTDLDIELAAQPSAIGYHAAASSTLTWNVLYGRAPMTITATFGNKPFPANDSLVVTPTEATTYTISATDAAGHHASKSVLVSVIKPPPPPSVTVTRSPNDGYNCLGVTDTVTWTVANCGTDCDVHLEGLGKGYATGYRMDLGHLRATGTVTIKPADEIDLTVTATSPAGSDVKHTMLTIADPRNCTSTTRPAWSEFYFAVEASNPAVLKCTWVAVAADTEANAKAAVQATYGSSYTVTTITANQFATQGGCPKPLPPQ